MVLIPYHGICNILKNILIIPFYRNSIHGSGYIEHIFRVYGNKNARYRNQNVFYGIDNIIKLEYRK